MTVNGYEWILVLGAIVLVFGSSQIPKLAKNLGRAQKEFKEGIAEGRSEGDESSAKSESAKSESAKSESGSDS